MKLILCGGGCGEQNKILYDKLNEIIEKIEELNKQDKNKLLSNVVTSDDIAGVISKWTSIPITKLISSEKEKLLNLYGYYIENSDNGIEEDVI